MQRCGVVCYQTPACGSFLYHSISKTCELYMGMLVCQPATSLSAGKFYFEVGLSQILKGAVVVALCHNEAEVKFRYNVKQISLTTCSVSEIWESMSIWHFTSASFWQSSTTTAPFKDWLLRLLSSIFYLCISCLSMLRVNTPSLHHLIDQPTYIQITLIQ